VRKALNDNPVVQAAVIGVLGVFVAFMLYTRVIKSEESAPAPAPTDAAVTEQPAAPAAEDASAAAPTGTEVAPATGAAPVPATEPPSTDAPVAPEVPSAPTTTATGFEPGPGLPKPVVRAYEQNEVIVLLVVRRLGPNSGKSKHHPGQRDPGTANPIDDRADLLAARALRRPDRIEEVAARIEGRLAQFGPGGARLGDRVSRYGDKVAEMLRRTAVFITGAGKISRYSRITLGVDVNRVPALVVVNPRSVNKGMPRASVSYGFHGSASIVQAVRDARYKGREIPYYPE
jgi:hypothetical protein